MVVDAATLAAGTALGACVSFLFKKGRARRKSSTTPGTAAADVLAAGSQHPPPETGGPERTPCNGDAGGLPAERRLLELQEQLAAAQDQLQRHDASLAREVALAVAREQDTWRSKLDALHRRSAEQAAAFSRDLHELQRERDAARRAAWTSSAEATHESPVDGPGIFQVWSDSDGASEDTDTASLPEGAIGPAGRVPRARRRVKKGGKRSKVFLVPSKHKLKLEERPDQEEMEPASSVVGATTSDLRVASAAPGNTAWADLSKTALSAGSVRGFRVADAAKISCGVVEGMGGMVSMRRRRKAAQKASFAALEMLTV